jgi:hypothetical protein
MRTTGWGSRMIAATLSRTLRCATLILPVLALPLCMGQSQQDRRVDIGECRCTFRNGRGSPVVVFSGLGAGWRVGRCSARSGAVPALFLMIAQGLGIQILSAARTLVAMAGFALSSARGKNYASVHSGRPLSGNALQVAHIPILRRWRGWSWWIPKAEACSTDCVRG